MKFEQQGEQRADYALEGLPNKVLAAEYRTAFPDETTIAAELDEARMHLDGPGGRKLPG